MSKKYYFKSSNLSLYKDGDKYFKNDDELKAEVESEEYTEIKFDKEIKIAVSSWVNNRFDNIICLIGAGASVVQGEDGKPDKNYGQTVQMIAENVFHELKNEKYVLNGEECNVLTLKTLVEKVQYIKNSVTDNEITDIFNLEDFLSYLLAFEKFVLDDEKVIFFNSK